MSGGFFWVNVLSKFQNYLTSVQHFGKDLLLNESLNMPTAGMIGWLVLALMPMISIGFALVELKFR